MDQYSPTNFLTTSDNSKSKFRSYTQKVSKADFLDDNDDHPDHLKSVTKKIKKENIVKRSYVNISNELRLELIEAVHTHDEKIKYAAKRLGINYSAAKAICQLYKREGRSNKKIPRRVNMKEGITYNLPESVDSLSPAEALLELCMGDKDDNTDRETNQTVSTKDSLGIVKGFTSDSSLSIQKSEEAVQKPENFESEEALKQSFPRQVESLDYEILKQIKQTRAIPNYPLESVYGQYSQPELEYPSMSHIPAQTPSIYSIPTPNSLLPLLPPTAQNHLHPIYPQGMNLLSNQINGMPSMVNAPLPLYMPPNLGMPMMPMMSLPQSLYQNLFYLPRQSNVWNSNLGNFPYNMQNYYRKP